MPKYFTAVFLTFFLLSATNAHALPITQADAFSYGDNLAIYDAATGIKWMDFGVNNGASVNDVLDNLHTIYKGWRLPSEAEVRNLWSNLFNNNDDKYQIFSLWGANKSPHDHSPYFCSGYFFDATGHIGSGWFGENGSIVNEWTTDKYYLDGVVSNGVYVDQHWMYDPTDPYFSFSGTFELSTLLVQDTTTVPEPSPLLMFSLGLLGLGFARRITR